MSTIPTTLSSRPVDYTVVGGTKGKGGGQGLPVSIVLLNRGSRLYRGEVFRELDRLGFESIVSIDEGADSRDIESLAGRYPRVRFLLLSGKASIGERVNLGIRESPGPFVFVLWDDMRLSTQALSSRFFERLASQNHLCVAPFVTTKGGEMLPTASAPALFGSSLKVLNLPPSRDGSRTLFPFDFCGIYSRERFVLTGGFDGGLDKPYWQKLDFGFRAWLWGEEIRLAQALKLNYIESSPEEDTTPDDCYKWFWLKNLAPQFRGDSAAMPPHRFWPYLRARRGGLLSAIGEFRSAREWVQINRYRFRSDAASLVDLWEDEGQ